MKFDQYYLYARIFPALLTAIPLILFHHFYINKDLSGFLHTVSSIHWIAEITMPLVFIFFLAFVSRLISKMIIENNHYSSEAKMPAINILLYENDFYSSQYKNKIHEKIFGDFSIKLLLPNEEKADETEARKRIVEAVSRIREKVKGGRLLLQHNMEYGFFRNLAGGSYIAAFCSILCVIFFYFFYPSPLAFRLSLIGSIVYISLLVFHTKILDWLGYQYAKRLFQEYMPIKQ